MAQKSDPHPRVAEMLPCNSLTTAGLHRSSTITALFLRHFAAFLNLVLNCLKGFCDWQLLGHVNQVICSPILLDINPLHGCLSLGTRPDNPCSLLQPVFASTKWEHKRIVCKFKIILLKVSQVQAFAKSQAFSSSGALASTGMENPTKLSGGASKLSLLFFSGCEQR